MTPFIAFVPDVVHHAGALPGNDRINVDANGVPIADPGNDMIFGDNATFVAPVVSGLAVIDNAAVQNTNELTGALQALHFAGLDYDQYLHTHAGGVGAAGETNQINIGNDVINGGSGDDVIFGDDARVVVPSMIGLQVPEASLKATALAYYDYLRDFQQITVDVEYAALESQGQILNALVADAKASGVVRPKSGVFSDPHYHTLAIGNDSIQGGDGGDLIIGDAGVVLSPFLVGPALDNGGVGIDSVSKNTLRAVNSALSTEATLRDRALALAIKQHHSNPEANSVEHKFPRAEDMRLIIPDYEYTLASGNDTLSGGSGDDVLVGDSAMLYIPSILSTGLNLGRTPGSLQGEVDSITKGMAGYLGKGARTAKYLPSAA